MIYFSGLRYPLTIVKLRNTPDKTLRQNDGLHDVVSDQILVTLVYSEFRRGTITAADPVMQHHVLQIHRTCCHTNDYYCSTDLIFH